MADMVQSSHAGRGVANPAKWDTQYNSVDIFQSAQPRNLHNML
jgi:hypothetical protein